MPDAAEQRLYFLLQRAAHRLKLDADRRCRAAAGISTAQLGALFAIRERPGITQRELAAELGQRESGITAMVGKLTAAELITRHGHPSEHRAVVLELTPAGTAALAALRPVADSFNQALRDTLGERQFAATVAALGKLTDWPTE